MRQIVKNIQYKQEPPITVEEAKFDNLYFARYDNHTYFLNRYHEHGGTWTFSWSLGVGTVLGGPARTLEDVIQYMLNLGGKVYQFKDWDDVLPKL